MSDSKLLAISTQRVAIDVDGSTMHAYVARPTESTGDLPGMLVFQEAFGINAHIRDVTERIAALGMVAIAPELFHRTGDGVEGSYTDFAGIQAHFGALTTEGLVADVKAAHGWLAERADPERIASIGFCMGGRVSYLANAHLPLRAAISFYGGGIAPALLDFTSRQHAPLLMFWGGLDTHIPPEQYRAVADALTAAGAVHEQVVFSQADHGFFCDARASYNPNAAQQAWALMRAFLATYGVLS